MKLAGKVAIVTGASRGIGKAIALALAETGADTVICARAIKDSPLMSVAEQIQQLGRRSLAIRANIAEETDVDNLVQKAMDEFGHIDILVNNAGITTPEPFCRLPIKKWDLVLSVNLRGTFLCTNAVLPQMIEQQNGSIINMSSILAQRIQYSLPYGVSKAAIERFTLGLAKELRKYNIAVNCLRPYFVKTEVVTAFLPDADTSDWESPEMWGKYTALVAAEDAQNMTGRILDQAALREIFGPV